MNLERKKQLFEVKHHSLWKVERCFDCMNREDDDISNRWLVCKPCHNLELDI